MKSPFELKRLGRNMVCVYANIGLAEIEYYLDLFMDCSFELCYLPGENVRDRLRDRFLVDEEELEREIIEYYYVK